jgi:integrase
VAAAWLEHRRTVGGCKRSTLTGYAAMLRQPGEARRKRPGGEGAHHVGLVVTYTPSEVLAIAEAARRGTHRELLRMSVGDAEQEIRRREDEQDACLIIVAAFSGLRMGELLALRWRHVIWAAQRLHVQRGLHAR